MSITTLLTAEQLFQMPEDGFRYELIDGEVKRMSPGGWEHGAIVGYLHTRIGAYIQAKSFGRMFGAETGFLLSRNPDTVRAPDIAFISKQHLPATKPETAYWPGAPDLAVEVVSPGDTMSEVDGKVQAWLNAGALAVWVVNPKWRSVTVYESATSIKVFTEADMLQGGEVLPGFTHPVGDIFQNA